MNVFRNSKLSRLIALLCAFALILAPRLALAPYGTGGTFNNARFADGTQTTPSISFINQTTTGLYRPATFQIGFTNSNTTDNLRLSGAPGVEGMRLGSSSGILWSDTPAIINAGSNDLRLVRDAASVLAQRNGTIAQAFRLYNTFTDASNFERLSVTWSANVLTLAAQAAGTGTQRRIDIVGTATNDAAAAGAIGELVISSVANNTVALTTNVTANVTSVSLTAGDWDCSGTVNFTFGATTSVTNLLGGFSNISATNPTLDERFDNPTAPQVPTAVAGIAVYVVPTSQRILASTTTIFLVTQASFTVSTIGAGGSIRCRRMR